CDCSYTRSFQTAANYGNARTHYEIRKPSSPSNATPVRWPDRRGVDPLGRDDAPCLDRLASVSKATGQTDKRVLRRSDPRFVHRIWTGPSTDCLCGAAANHDCSSVLRDHC